ncbi:hypothetical protein VFPFJ_00065 [Purpureocillium lilacinum]|uniref:Uncharacterized protein n=1 Tax=Purpureocillium lilacinum TaxID=33203 RepID=A0A179HUA3_PURLI|nr:hypothetical protein VFPFJ_00065 [Purpureocillium lilacinum]OAQ93957.1 hypothetical protein VFPFJ_00065 [Purpureocillium lilacinum]
MLSRGYTGLFFEQPVLNRTATSPRIPALCWWLSGFMRPQDDISSPTRTFVFCYAIPSPQRYQDPLLPGRHQLGVLDRGQEDGDAYGELSQAPQAASRPGTRWRIRQGHQRTAHRTQERHGPEEAATGLQHLRGGPEGGAHLLRRRQGRCQLRVSCSYNFNIQCSRFKVEFMFKVRILSHAGRNTCAAGDQLKATLRALERSGSHYLSLQPAQIFFSLSSVPDHGYLGVSRGSTAYPIP